MFTYSAYKVESILAQWTDIYRTRKVPLEDIIKCYEEIYKVPRSRAEEVVWKGLSQLREYDVVRYNDDSTIEYLLAKV